MSRNQQKKSGKRDLHYFPDQKYDCINCGKCCTKWEINLTAAEKARLEALDVPGYDMKNGSYFEPCRGTTLFKIKKDQDRRCVFMGKDNLCAIHKHHGEKVKPLACRLYPFDVFNWQDGSVSAGIRYDCPAAAQGCGKKLSSREKRLLDFADEMIKARKSYAVYSKSLDPGIEKLRLIAKAYKKILLCKDFPVPVRFYSASRLLEFHSNPDFSDDIKDADESFFIDDAFALAQRSIEDLSYVIESTEPVNVHNRVLFRFLLGGYVRDDEITLTKKFIPKRIYRSWLILKFMLGKGSLRDLCDTYPDTSELDPFKTMQEVKYDPAAFEVYWDFLANQLDSLHFCGGMVTKYTFEQGMRHLILTLPVACAFASLNAVRNGRSEVTKEDVTQALLIIDRTFSYSPFFALRNTRNITFKLCSEKFFPSFLQIIDQNWKTT